MTNSKKEMLTKAAQVVRKVTDTKGPIISWIGFYQPQLPEAMKRKHTDK